MRYKHMPYLIIEKTYFWGFLGAAWKNSVRALVSAYGICHAWATCFMDWSALTHMSHNTRIKMQVKTFFDYFWGFLGAAWKNSVRALMSAY